MNNLEKIVFVDHHTYRDYFGRLEEEPVLLIPSRDSAVRFFSPGSRVVNADESDRGTYTLWVVKKGTEVKDTIGAWACRATVFQDIPLEMTLLPGYEVWGSCGKGSVINYFIVTKEQSPNY